jgi:Na+-transporting NADH:ubiquinone oxidoreductase subunit C
VLDAPGEVQREPDDDGDLVSVKVVKGGAAPGDPHGVDAISGATMTSDGVTKFLKSDLALYEPFFSTIRKGD